eukprot:maker-scaffold_50-snap-gene-1.4-mRNA-1 protein AED:0.00 eAED:0.00 QI:25/1/1/1/1/1/2/113/158
MKYKIKLKFEDDSNSQLVESITTPNLYCANICQQGGNEKREGIFFSRDEEQELENSRGKANFVLKFGKKKSASLNFIKEKKINEVEEVFLGKEGIIGIIECRGLEIEKIILERCEGIKVKGIDGKLYPLNFEDEDFMPEDGNGLYLPLNCLSISAEKF